MKPILIKATVVVAVIGGVLAYFSLRNDNNPLGRLVSTSKPKIRLTRVLTDDELKVAVSAMRQHHTVSPAEPKITSLGSKFFFDAGFSENGQISCASCHQPAKSFTDGKSTAEGLAKTAMNAPTIINSYAGEWFFWNGRADSLEAQALGPVENSKEHGFSRMKVVAHIAKNYKAPYEALFGPLPKDLPETTALPPPSAKPTRVSSEVAAYALATLGSPELLKNILRRAQSDGLQPVEVLKTMSSGTAEQPNAFDQLPEAQSNAVNTVFGNFGRAIAAFERTIITTDAPFDKFADNLGAGKSPDAALLEGFSAQELRGLRLFTGRGNCTLCHQGSHFTDQQFHNIGMMALSSETVDLGRSQGMLVAEASEFNCRGNYLKQTFPSQGCQELQYLETESADAVGAFKTPTLRNLRDTSPYGHDGRFPELNSILQHYNHLGVPTSVGHIEESLKPLGLSADELKDLEAFLMSLSSSVSYFKGD